ncbi:hypothetical protein SDRG_11449 [Saprolegnia diclina VS20]|uniref:Uncharacterized protein n=1 Tax=Saprolegnia diclina (strain VS20) TaxID=1156394 RepID=T0Q8N4_SAPDV|nr:hypothetical protein SDRG_11449 [Saprolegnia diclina VS20]EQC30976.1 hypothetical protein SDRG_11449 [Saprolegnia diclina VS20]|eukprot:XP_008615714.1 hypothetical protein SDRG_11449 [Saprolegnia diclina VS20]
MEPAARQSRTVQFHPPAADMGRTRVLAATSVLLTLLAGTAAATVDPPDALCSATACVQSLLDAPCIRGSAACYDYNCLYMQKKIVYCTNPTFGGCQNGVICPKNVSTPAPTSIAPSPSTSTTSLPTTRPPVTATTTPNPTTLKPLDDASTSSNNTTSIVLGILLGLVSIAALIAYMCIRKRRAREEAEDTDLEITSCRHREPRQAPLPQRHFILASSAQHPSQQPSSMLDSVASKSMFNTTGRQSNHDLMSQKSDWWQHSTPSNPSATQYDTRGGAEPSLCHILEERKTETHLSR